MEEWKDIEGFEGLYQVSNTGRVRSLDHETNGKRYQGRILTPGIASGYLIVRLSRGFEKTSKRVHRLVADAFIPNPLNKPEVNHLDGDKSNNHVDNLEWATHRENTDHAWLTGLTKLPPPRPIRVVQIYEGEEIAEYKSIDIAAYINKISAEDICKCCKGKRKNAGRYSWKYKEVKYGN